MLDERVAAAATARRLLLLPSRFSSKSGMGARTLSPDMQDRLGERTCTRDGEPLVQPSQPRCSCAAARPPRGQKTDLLKQTHGGLRDEPARGLTESPKASGFSSPFGSRDL